METRLVWLFDYINPYLQIGFATVSLLCGIFAIWSASRRFKLGVLLLGLGCVGSFIQSSLFAVSAFQDGQPFLPLPLEIRRAAYLGGRLLGPWQAILFTVTVVLLARDNLRGPPKA